MKQILIVALIAFTMNAKAQIILEQTYDSAGTYNVPSSRGSQLMIIRFEFSGERYVKINRAGHCINIYDMTHALVKTISLANVPLNPPNGQIGDILYLSQGLFNKDSKIEFMQIHEFTELSGNGNFTTNIYNEDGALLFTDTSAAWVRPNYEMQQWPIYNTPSGTKMLLSTNKGQAKVFSLPGKLSCDNPCGNGIATNINVLNPSGHGGLLSNPYPNPTNNTTTINYTFPENVNEGTIVFYNLQGKEVKRFKVDKTFNNLQVSTIDIAEGTYYYQLQTNDNVSSGMKLVIVK